MKKSAEINPRDIEAHPVWATFYEPEEMVLLEQLGFDRQEVEQLLSSVGYSDEYAFPLPASAAALGFKHQMLSAKATTPSGTQLPALRTRLALHIYHGEKTYHLSKNLVDLSQVQAKDLAAALGESRIFPLTLTTAALGTSEQFFLVGPASNDA